MARPNIIFYFSDQQRWDTMGCYGQALNVTPNLDRLAAEGTLYENAYTCQPVCGPARACLQTGTWATENGCFRNDIELPLGQRTLAHYFADAGYDTAYIGKWHLASNADKGIDYTVSPVPAERRGGYRYWMAADVLEFTSHGYNGYVYDADNTRHDFIGYRVDAINNFAIDYLHRRAESGDERPFFLFISQIDPHHQNDHARYEGPDGSKAKFADYTVPGDLVGTGGNWRQNYPDYLGQCHSLDENVGKLVDTLKEQGIWDNTILIYTSDHGSHFCTRNSEYKRSCHDGCIHLPLIITGPGFTGGGSNRDMVSLLDLPATMLDMAGIPVPEEYAGRSLVQLAQRGNAGWQQSVFLQISESQVGRAVRTKQWKYAVRANAEGWVVPGADVYYEDYLYDLAADPHERCNLVDDPAYESVRAELAALLTAEMVKAGERAPAILPRSAMPADMIEHGPESTAIPLA